MAIYGYARVSSEDQDCSIQVAQLKAAGCTVVRSEKRSGTTTQGRTELENLLDFMEAGDTLMVTKIDRLARSIRDLSDLVHHLEVKGVALEATDQPVETRTAAGRAFLGMLGVFAEFETALRKERQTAGIEKAKAEGRYRGRKPSIQRDQIVALQAEGLGPTEIAKRLQIGRASVYRLVKEPR